MRRRKASARCSFVTRGETGPPPKALPPNRDNPPGLKTFTPEAKTSIIRMRPRGIRPSCAKFLRRKPARVNSTMTPANRASTSTDTIAESMAMSPAGCGLPPLWYSRYFTRRRADCHIPAALCLTTRDGMNHQDFVLCSGNFLDAFPGGDVERLRTSLRFVFRDDPVDFVHVGGRGIIFEKGGVALGRKRHDLGIHIWSPAGLTFWLPVGGSRWVGNVPKRHIAPLYKDVKTAFAGVGENNSLLLVLGKFLNPEHRVSQVCISCS